MHLLYVGVVWCACQFPTFQAGGALRGLEDSFKGFPSTTFSLLFTFFHNYFHRLSFLPSQRLLYSVWAFPGAMSA